MNNEYNAVEKKLTITKTAKTFVTQKIKKCNLTMYNILCTF